MDERRLMNGKTYRHFKGKEYQVLGTAMHTEHHELVVVYKSNENGKIWARPYREFMSEVDREKYPDAQQKYRFELVKDGDGK